MAVSFCYKQVNHCHSKFILITVFLRSPMSLALCFLDDADPTSPATFNAISPVGEGTTGPVTQWKQLRKNAPSPSSQSNGRTLQLIMLIVYSQALTSIILAHGLILYSLFLPFSCISTSQFAPSTRNQKRSGTLFVPRYSYAITAK